MELKPCPFCGSTNLSTEDARDFVSCRGCHAEGPLLMGGGSEATAEAWNKRAYPRVKMDDLVTQIRRLGDAGFPVCNDAADTIERLRAEVAHWRDLESQAAEYVECVIISKSSHFSGEKPYVGWKGLGLALGEDYDDLKVLRAEVEALRSLLKEALEVADNWPGIAYTDDLIARSKAALPGWVPLYE